MGFPVTIHGSEGEIYQTHATDKKFPLGTQIVLQDGRKYRYVLNGAGTGVAGTLYTGAANVTNHITQSTQAATAIGARAIPVTLGATAVLANEYAEGWVNSQTLSSGGGYAYKVDVHPSNAGGGTFSIPLATGHAVQVALTATTSKLDLIHSPYWKVVIAATTRIAVPAGVMVIPLAAAAYGWVQTQGIASVATEGTVVLAQYVQPSTSAAGAVAPLGGASSVVEIKVGIVQRVAATTQFSVIFLTLDG